MSIRVPISTAITTRVLARGAQRRARLVVATAPGLVAATAGTTLGAPTDIPIPRLVGPRSTLPTLRSAQPAGAPSVGLLQPPEISVLSLLEDVQEPPELVVHA